MDCYDNDYYAFLFAMTEEQSDHFGGHSGHGRSTIRSLGIRADESWWILRTSLPGPQATPGKADTNPVSSPYFLVKKTGRVKVYSNFLKARTSTESYFNTAVFSYSVWDDLGVSILPNTGSHRLAVDCPVHQSGRPPDPMVTLW